VVGTKNKSSAEDFSDGTKDERVKQKKALQTNPKIRGLH